MRPIYNDIELLHMANKHIQKAGQLCEMERRHKDLSISGHCPEENTWEAFNTQSGFAELRQGVLEGKGGMEQLHSFRGLRKPQNPYLG